jgi:serine/threonine-protein kinase
MVGLTSPNLIGKTLIEAQGICEPLGINLKIEGEEKGEKSLITSQDPPAGEPVADKIINVKTENLALVPELTGLKLADARDSIIKKGFLVGFVNYREVKDGQADTVLEQDPQAGLELQQGTKINIVIIKIAASPHGTPPVMTTPEPTPESAPPSPSPGKER